MGFKKTEKGNVIYEFDFTPTKLVPLAPEDANGYRCCYAVEGANGERAPILVEFQGERYRNYALAFAFINTKDCDRLGTDMCVCTNIPLVATLAKMDMDFEVSYDELKESYERIDPRDTKELARINYCPIVMSLADASAFFKKNHIPNEGYDILREKAS